MADKEQTDELGFVSPNDMLVNPFGAVIRREFSGHHDDAHRQLLVS